MCEASVFASRWAMAAGELRGEMGKAVMPERHIPAIRVKYVIDSGQFE